MPKIEYFGPLARVVMTVEGLSEPGDEDHIVERGAQIEVSDEVAAALCDGVGACWKRAEELPEPNESKE